MVRSSITLILAISLSTTICFSQTENKKKDGFLEDLKFYKEIVETSHTGMYLYTSKSEFDSIFKTFKKRIETGEISTYNEFFLLLARVHTKINCGHSSMYPSPKLFPNIEENQKIFFPLQVKFIKNTLILASDFNNLKKGTQIIKINNKSIEEIRSDAFQIISSDGFNTTFKYRQLEEEFSLYYFLLYGIQEKYSLDVVPYHSEKPNQITVNGVSSITEQASEEKEATDLSYINKNTALLTVNTFSTETKKNQKAFFKFLNKSFKEIHEKGIENLIIDIRENTGGDDGNDMELASYLINKPFKENKYRKLNTNELPLFPEYLHPQWKKMMGISEKKTPEQIKIRLKKEINSEFFLGEDSTYYYKEKNVIKRDPNKYLFSGETYILTSGKVFSGGALFSALVRDKSNAIFVGEETGGGYYRHTGSIPLIYELPNSKIAFSIFIVINEQDVEQNLFPNGSGIIPHFEIHPTIKSFVEGKDTVLNFVKEKINEK